jgi:ElaB/YqjD/DUF883 family membrane-anchored ribosome-binding protein
MPQSDAPKSKAELEAELEGSSDAIHGRLEAIQDEINTTGDSIRSWLRKHPLASVGGSLVAGALAGWLLAGVGRRRLSSAHRQLLSQYITALREEVEDAVASGQEVGTAVQEALRTRAPLVVYEGESASSGGWIRQAFGLVADTALALIVREAISGWLDDADLDAMLPDDVPTDVTEAAESSAS